MSTSQTLYRKYRPRVFSEVEGQEHVVRTLQGALLSGQIGHAYLFCGPRGTGKTTMARLFAKAINCENLSPKTHNLKPATIEPCDHCAACRGVSNGNWLDLIEVDAASNRGIDEIRNLKESARVAASSGAYKIFIVDEVHMLTKDAFNALLKTLEEPPAHVLFILATTEAHKLPETILSRVQRFDFKKVTSDQIITKLKRIVQAEKLTVEEAVLTALADHAAGSLRDAESALAKLVAYSGNKITTSQATELLGIVPRQLHGNLLALISQGNAAGALAVITDLHEAGVDLENFTKQFVNYTRGQLLANIATPGGDSQTPANLVRVLNVFIKAKAEFKHSPLPQLPLELAVLGLTHVRK